MELRVRSMKTLSVTWAKQIEIERRMLDLLFYRKQSIQYLRNVLILGWRLSARAAYYGNATRDRTHDENVASEESQKN